MVLIDKEPDGSGGIGWTIKLRSNDSFCFRIGSNTAYQDVTANSAYTPGVSVHISCTFKDSTNTAKIYVNGKLITTSTSIAYSINTTTSNLRLGIPSTVLTNEKFDGILQEVKIYNTALSDAQIAALTTETSYVPTKL